MFGDYTYGTEILDLPLLNEAFESDVNIQQRNQPSQPNQTPNKQEIDEIDSFSLYWFRWITGHQTMFIFWQILNKTLKKMENEGLNEENLVLCKKIVDGCSLIYEYTGSCPQDYYHQYVRPFMGLTHKAFSGSWASDYGKLPQLTRRIATLPCSSQALIEKQKHLKKAYSTSQKAHVSIAKRLVPESASMLKEAKNEGLISTGQVQDHHQELYDFFFLVRRTRVSFQQMEQSLLGRMTAICDDLKTTPLSFTTVIEGHHLDILQQARESSVALLQLSETAVNPV